MEKGTREQRDQEIHKELALGMSQKEVGEHFGLSKSAVGKIAKRDRALIEAQARELLSLVPTIIGQVKNDIETSGKLTEFLTNTSESAENPTRFDNPKDALHFMKLAYEEKKDILQATGVYPSNQKNVYIQQIYEDNRIQVLSPKVLGALGAIFGGNADVEDPDEDVFEAEIVEREEEREEEEDG